MFQIFSTAIIFFYCAVTCAAQSGIPNEIDSAFAAGDYERVELLALRLQQEPITLSTEELVRINLTAGYAMIMMNREEDARACFRKVLDADSTTHLDPVRISPKFRMVFDEVKANYRREGSVPPQKTPAQILCRGPQPSSVLSNLILPGSGQWHEGRRVRGIVFLGAQIVAAGFLVRQLDRLNQSRETYLGERNPERISSAYERYNRDYQSTWTVGILNGFIYLAAQTDLALMKKKYPENDVISSVNCIPINSGVVVALTIRW
jgi:hypothetical protein